MKHIKFAVVLALSFMSANAFAAAGTSNWAVPTEVRTLNTGIKISGAFGNKGQCSDTSGAVYVANNSNEYEYIKAMALAAFMAGKEMSFYIIGCEVAVGNGDMQVVYRSRNVAVRN
ncbi:hypothetical protein ACFL2V_07160 [Pseudomonadota bacterium]